MSVGKRTIHAYMIGINQYEGNIPPLTGCVNDVQAVAQFLETFAANNSFTLAPPHILVNEEATRAQMVDSFRKYLINPAQEGDMCVFHFSGHGGQEIAPPEFLAYEPDQLLEGLVCHDSGRGGKPLLADKELRYLIHLLAQKGCDIVTIFDCCHSGDNTRNREDLSSEWAERRLSEDAATRKWEDFIFAEEEHLKYPSAMEHTSWDELVPQGRHVQLAACYSHESAYENRIRKQGFFTQNLLEVLNESQGALSYLELQRRVRQRLYARSLPQTPQIRAPHVEDMFKTFLSGELRESPIGGNILYHGYEKYWTFNMGTLHGLDSGESPQVVVEVSKTKQICATLKDIGLNSSRVEFSLERFSPAEIRQLLDQKITYKGYVSGLMRDQILIYLSGEDTGIQKILHHAQVYAQMMQDHRITITENPETATYKIIAKDNALQLLSQEDSRLIIEPIQGYTEEAVWKLMGKLRHISQWSFSLSLQPPTASPSLKNPLAVKVYEAGKPVQVPDPETGVIQLVHAHPDRQEEVPRIRFQFINQSSRSLYIACLHLNQNFSVDPTYLEPAVVKLAPEQEVWAFNGQEVRLGMPTYIREGKIATQYLYFVLIAAMESFEVDSFYLPPLRMPQEEIAPGREFVRPDPSQSMKGYWTTQRIEFRVKNPCV